MIKDTDFIEYFDKDIVRQEKIMKILIQEDKWHNLDDLANEIQWAKKTIRKDLIILKDILPSGWGILTSKGRGIRLIKPLESSLENIIYLIRKNTKSFQIFQCILSSKNISVLSLSKQLFIPYRATREIVKKIEIHLMKYGLELITRPYLQIVGSEFAIRAYVTRFYVNVYAQHWPFKDLDRKIIMNYLSAFERNLGITLFKGDKHRLTVCLYTLINRIKRKKSINMPQKDIELLENTQFYEAFSKVVTRIEKEHSISFSKHEIIYFTVLLIGSKYSYNDKDFSKKQIAERMRNKIDDSYVKVHACIDALEKKLGLPLWNDEELLFQLSLCFRRILFQFKIYSPELVVNSPNMITDSSLVKVIKTKYESVFKAVKEELELFFEEYEREVPDEEIAIVTLHIEANKMVYNSRPIQVLLHVAENQGMYRYIDAWLKKNFQDQIDVVPFSKKDIRNISKYSMNSIIVTNIYLDIETSIPIITISNLPNNRDKYSILTFITG
ncbi:PRD domain-containing protein [Bacillus cereus]|uniref:BglG family transcription antiterminator n=1 Tax=Bacillus cereus group TaxID=86661 RepID=UPI0009CEBEAA|nr:PRD domain-containing protein [Bacillus cereus]OPA24192.1 hypothetical protein BHL53_14620 [Bacillus cereus]